MIVALIFAVLLTAAIVLAVRGSRRRRLHEDRLLDELGQVGGLTLTQDRRWIEVTRDASPEAGPEIHRWDRRRVLRAIDLATRLPGRSPARALGAVAAFLSDPPRPLPGRFELKRHGVATVPRLVGPEVAALDLFGLARLDSPGLARLYRTDEGTFVTRDQLDDVGIDPAALDGVALAVLRQRTNFEPVDRALAGEEVEWVEEDGCASSRLLLVPERLGPGVTLHAWIADADRCTISKRPIEPMAPDRDRDGPILGVTARIDAAGLRFD